MNKDNKHSAAPKIAGSFEAISISNGNMHWTASALQEWLGYASPASFKQAISRAMTVCNTLGIPVYDHFDKYTENGKTEFKLTRFACYLIAMNGDPKKPQVAAAQAYFAQMAEIVSNVMANAESVERVYMRYEISERTGSLNKAAQQRDVENYGRFHNAGYMGLYNMAIWDLKKIKGLEPDNKQTPLDFMGKRELAANLFRLAETEGRIQSDPNIRGQKALESTAHKVGQEVRGVMDIEPEKLAQDIPEDIKVVKRGLKKIPQQFKKIDKPSKGGE